MDYLVNEDVEKVNRRYHHDLESLKGYYFSQPCYECGEIIQGIQNFHPIRKPDNSGVAFVCNKCFDANKCKYCKPITHIHLEFTANRPVEEEV